MSELKALPVAIVVTHEGHSFGTLRNLLPRMLRHLFPRGAGTAPPSRWRADDHERHERDEHELPRVRVG